jgi:hypothetical protein
MLTVAAQWPCFRRVERRGAVAITDPFFFSVEPTALPGQRAARPFKSPADASPLSNPSTCVRFQVRQPLCQSPPSLRLCALDCKHSPTVATAFSSCPLQHSPCVPAPHPCGLVFVFGPQPSHACDPANPIGLLLTTSPIWRRHHWAKSAAVSKQWLGRQPPVRSLCTGRSCARRG